MLPVPNRILHLSDLHIGATKGINPEWALAPLVERFDPALVIASGDLSHRGTPEQHAQAAELLQGLGRPLLVVPGNHDIPYTFPARFTRTYVEFERHWKTTEPVFESEQIVAVGLNSVRPWRNQTGRVRDEQLRRATRGAPRREGRGAARRGPASPSDRRAVAFSQEAGRASGTTCSPRSWTRARS